MKKTKKVEEEDSKSEDQGGNPELHELFLDELADILNAETQLTKALPKMAKAAQADELREAIESHVEETKGHIERLKQVFESVNEKPKSKICKATKGLVEEGSDLLEELKGKSSIDSGIIAASQKIEHYEIASYGTVVAWAHELGLDEAAKLLEETLDEEKAADEALTEIAESLASARGEEPN